MTVLAPLLDRPMPQSPDAERAVLGAILIRNSAFYRVANLTDAHFFKDGHRTIYRTMALMAEEGVVIEPLTLKEELAKRGLLDMVGGAAYLSSLIDTVPDIANVERYAAIVERMAKKRAGIVAGYELVTQSFDAESEPEDVAASAMASLSPVATREDQQAQHIASVLSGAFARQQALATADQSVALDCGWPSLNERKVFFPTLIVCSADRGLGKSGLMVQWSRNMALNGHPNAMFSLESAPHDIGLRYASTVTGIPHSYMRDWRTLTDANRAKIAECLREAAGLGIHIAKGPRTVEGIILEIRRLKAMFGIQCAFIDYFQLLGSSKRYERHELMMGDIAQTLLASAIDNDVAICAFSQVNKEGNVAYADSIEKSARVRLHFERPHRDDRDRNCYVDFSILKNNEERTDAFVAHFNEVNQQWAEGLCHEVGHRVPAERKLFA